MSCFRVSDHYCYWDSYIDDLGSTFPEHRYQAQVILRPGISGHLAFSVEKDQTEYLRSLRFSWAEISNLIRVSCMTLYRQR